MGISNKHLKTIKQLVFKQQTLEVCQSFSSLCHIVKDLEHMVYKL